MITATCNQFNFTLPVTLDMTKLASPRGLTESLTVQRTPLMQTSRGAVDHTRIRLVVGGRVMPLVMVGFSGQNKVQEYVKFICGIGGMHSRRIYTAAGKTGPGGSVRSTTGIAGGERARKVVTGSTFFYARYHPTIATCTCTAILIGSRFEECQPLV